MLKEKNIIKAWKGKVILTAIEDLKGAIWRRRRSHKHKQNHITGFKDKTMPRWLSTASFQFSKRFVDHRNDVKNQVVNAHGKVMSICYVV